jgi:hypothetical protein
MRNKAVLLLSAATFTVGLSSLVRAADVPPAIRSRYDSLLAATEKMDVKAFGAFVSPDYVSIDPAGKKTNRADYLAGISDLMKGAKKVTTKFQPKGSKTHGSIVDVPFDFQASLIKDDGTTKVHEVGTDSWKKIGGNWIMVKTVDTRFDVVAPKPAAKPTAKPMAAPMSKPKTP